MDAGDGEKFIVPALFDYDAGTHHYCNLAVVRPTVEREEKSEVDNNERVLATSALTVNSDDSFPTHLVSLNDTNLKYESQMENSASEFWDRTADGDENRRQVYEASSPCTPKTFRDNSSHGTKKNILISCFVIFVIATVTLACQLNKYTSLTLQLQAELNQMNTLLKDCRGPRGWLIDGGEINEDTNSFQIETCWLGARFTLGPCGKDPLWNIKDMCKKPYQYLSSYYNEARSWWAVSPNDPYTITSNHDSPERILWYQQNAKEVHAQMRPLTEPSSNAMHQCYFWSMIKSWFGGESKSPTIKHPTQDEEESFRYSLDSFINVLQNNTIFQGMQFTGIY